MPSWCDRVQYAVNGDHQSRDERRKPNLGDASQGPICRAIFGADEPSTPCPERPILRQIKDALRRWPLVCQCVLI